MLNTKEILKDPKRTEEKLKKKDPSLSLTPLINSYEKMCQKKTEFEYLKSKLNTLSKEIGEKKQRKENVDSLLDEVVKLKNHISNISLEVTKLEAEYEAIHIELPNIPDDDIKVSYDPKDNVCTKSMGKKREFSFPIKNHVELGEELDLFDFKRGAKTSGAGWPVYKGLGAQIEWALLNIMIECHIKNGFTFHLLPHLVRPEIMFGSGQLPKFDAQLFKITDPDYQLYLIPTAEVALNGLHYDEILEEDDLPKLYAAYTPCFRREAGASGKKERGLIRVHQFNKIEMFAFTKPDESDLIFDRMILSAEEILDKLELHYRNMLLVTGDMSYAASRTVDMEVWLPAQDRYYEVSSISNCRDFQARRSKIRYKSKLGGNEFVHTLNGSGLATSRLMVALLENNQNKDGSVTLPPIFEKYLGTRHIEKKRTISV